MIDGFSYMFLTGFLLNNLYIITTSLLVLIYRKLPIYTFDTLSDSVNTNDLLKQIREDKSFITSYSFKDGMKKPQGLFYNFKKKYIGFITNYPSAHNYSTKMASRVTFYGILPIKIKSLNEDIDDLVEALPKKEKKKTFTLYLGESGYESGYKDIKQQFNFTPKKNQKNIMKKIETLFNENKFSICRALIYGVPGSGKSFIGKLLAKKYESHYCFDINLLEPGTPVLDLWQRVMPTKDKPLIIQIDEFDIIIEKIHNNNDIVKPHQWLRRNITDKQSYNTFMSEYLICLPNVIYLFTMNRDPEYINALDSSYIRNNRMDLVMSIDGKNEKQL